MADPVPGYGIGYTISNRSVGSVSNAGRVSARQLGNTAIRVSAGDLGPVDVPFAVVPRTLEGKLVFDHAGDRTGSFDVQSTFQYDHRGIPTTPDWAVSYWDANFESWEIVAFRQRSGTLGDLAWLWIYPDPMSGSVFTWNPPACAEGYSPTCPAGGVVAFGIDLSGSGEQLDELWPLIEAEVSVSQGLPGDRLIATFQAGGGIWNDSTEVFEGEFTVTGGEIDVRIVPEQETSPPQGAPAAVAGAADPFAAHPGLSALLDSLRHRLRHPPRHRPLR